VNNLDLFPLEINKAPLEMLLRVPGIGVTSAKRIVTARRSCSIDFSGLKKLGAVIKRAQYFVTCGGKTIEGLKLTSENVLMGLLSDKSMQTLEQNNYIQTSIFDNSLITREDVLGCLTGQM